MKHLKIFLTATVMLIMAISFASCGSSGSTSNISDAGDSGGTMIGGENSESKTGDETPDEGNDMNVLVVYFSCTNTTKSRAEALQARLGADIYRIQPETPYTSADLNYNNNDCRANREQHDENCRPAISGSIENIGQYDVVYIGYPIWWGQAPKIIYTFLESYDFNGVTLIPFCTSGGSDIGTSGTNLHNSAPDAIWKEGCLVRSTNDIDTLVNMK